LGEKKFEENSEKMWGEKKFIEKSGKIRGTFGVRHWSTRESSREDRGKGQLLLLEGKKWHSSSKIRKNLWTKEIQPRTILWGR